MPSIQLLNRINRQGSFITPTYTVPLNATGTFSFRTDMLESALSTAGYGGSIMIEVSSNGGATWTIWFGLTWESGNVSRVGPTVHNPGMTVDISTLAGKMIRAQITLVSRVSIGFVVETT